MYVYHVTWKALQLWVYDHLFSFLYKRIKRVLSVAREVIKNYGHLKLFASKRSLHCSCDKFCHGTDKLPKAAPLCSTKKIKW